MHRHFSLNIILFFLLTGTTFHGYSQKPVEVKAEATGLPFGNVIKVSISNPNYENLVYTLNPMWIQADPNYTGFVVPGGISILVPANKSSEFYLAGFTTDPAKKVYPKGFVFNDADNWPSKKHLPYDSLKTKAFERKLVKKSSNNFLIPFDFLALVPGGYDLIDYRFKSIKNDEYYNLVLLQAIELTKGYEKLFVAGKIITEFNNNPTLERNILIQNAIWISAFYDQGIAFNKKHLRKSIRKFFNICKKNEETTANISNSFDLYLRVIERLGRESNVFIAPEDLDHRRASLPENQGFSLLSDNVKSPTIVKDRVEYKCIKNQQINVKNTCLSCSIPANNLPASLYIHSVEPDTLLALFHQKMVGSQYSKAIVDSVNNKIAGFPGFNTLDWLKDENLSRSERASLALNYFKELINTAVKNNPSGERSSELESFLFKCSGNLSAMLEMYKSGNLSYTFDCCDALYQPKESHYTIAGEMLDALTQLKKMITEADSELVVLESMKKKQPEKTTGLLVFQGLSLYAYHSVLQLFLDFGGESQTICLSGPQPDIRSVAIKRVINEFGVDMTGFVTYYNGKLATNRSAHKIVIRFGDCNCGASRETELPVFNETSKIDFLNKKTQLSKLIVIPQYEIGATVVKNYFDNEGADKFNGGNISNAIINSIGKDDIYKLNFGDSYFIGPMFDFSFQEMTGFHLHGGFYLTNWFQLNADGGLINGHINAQYPVTYFSIPGDTQSRMTENYSVYSSLNIYSASGGFRSYLGKSILGFAGINYGFQYFKNTFTRVDAGGYELRLPKKTFSTATFLSGETGMRYKFNQEFYIESGIKLSKRWDNDAFSQPLQVFDKAVFFGAGVQF